MCGVEFLAWLWLRSVYGEAAETHCFELSQEVVDFLWRRSVCGGKLQNRFFFKVS